jgi:hypothetical protein
MGEPNSSRRERRPRPWGRPALAALALAVAAACARAAPCAAAAGPSSPAAVAARLAREPFVSSCPPDGGRAADGGFVTAAAAALVGDSRLAVADARFAGACVSLGHAAPGAAGGDGGGAGALAPLFPRAVVLSSGAAEHAAGPRRAPGAPGASASTQAGDPAVGAFDAAALEFTVNVAPDAPEGQQLVMRFAFATEEGARKRGGAPRPDAAAVFVGPAGAGAGGERNVALLPGSGRRVDAAAVLGEGVEGLVVRNEGGAKATALAAYTQVRGGLGAARAGSGGAGEHVRGGG